jgi:glycosyltransferase involved in cell wall biosynthesis
MPDLAPTVTFIMPIQGKPEFLVEQINAVFRFSDHYRGFCELIVVVDETAKETEAIAKIVGLAVKINGVNHPHVRARVLHCTSTQSLNGSVEIALTHSLGDKIMIVANGELTKFNPSQLCGLGMGQREILVAEYFLDESAFEGFIPR